MRFWGVEQKKRFLVDSSYSCPPSECLNNSFGKGRLPKRESFCTFFVAQGNPKKG
jgi:hypothetical protein